MKNKGFTLIELLVVVIIVAILAAIAIPQYQNAVRKTYLSNAWVMIKSIKDAVQLYYLTKGSYDGMSWKNIPVEMPAGCVVSTASWTVADGQLSCPGRALAAFSISKNGKDIFFDEHFDGTASLDILLGYRYTENKFYCETTGAKKFCEMLGGVAANISNCSGNRTYCYILQ